MLLLLLYLHRSRQLRILRADSIQKSGEIVRRHLDPVWYERVLMRYPEQEWRDNVRVSRRLFNSLLAKLQEISDLQLIRTGVDLRFGRPRRDLQHRLAATLWALAHGQRARVTGHVFGIPHTSMKRCMDEVLDLIGSLIDEVVQWPDDEDKHILACVGDLSRKHRTTVCGTIGALDGTHIRCMAMSNGAGTDCYGYKGYASILCEAVCDTAGRIIAFEGDFCGSNHDSSAWQDCEQFISLQAAGGLKDGYVVLADGAYELLDWQLKGWGRKQLSTNKRRRVHNDVPRPSKQAMKFFTHVLSSQRNIIERVFARIKGMWRCFYFPDVTPQRAVQQIRAAVVLHNLTLFDRGDTMQQPALRWKEAVSRCKPTAWGQQYLVVSRRQWPAAILAESDPALRRDMMAIHLDKTRTPGDSRRRIQASQQERRMQRHTEAQHAYIRARSMGAAGLVADALQRFDEDVDSDAGSVVDTGNLSDDMVEDTD